MATIALALLALILGCAQTMAKRKGKQAFAVILFIKIWKHLTELLREKEQFALAWLWVNEDAFVVFVREVVGIEVQKCSRGLLHNGYRDCKKNRFIKRLFSDYSWGLIDMVFQEKHSMSNLPGSLRRTIRYFGASKKDELIAYLRANIRLHAEKNQYSSVEVEVTKVSPEVLGAAQNCFLGSWEEGDMEFMEPHIAPLCRRFPKSFLVMDARKNINWFYDLSGKEPVLIAVHVTMVSLTSAHKLHIRRLLVQLFKAHKAIIRSSCVSLDSHITGFGPFHHRFQKGGGNKVSFYTHALKLNAVLKDCLRAKQFEVLVDRYAHGSLTDIILALYLCWCPQVLQSFFNFLHPYLGDSDYNRSELEKQLKGNGPSAYQLYITEDYCSEVHVDRDLTDYTLCYASHPDADTTSPVDFVLAGYGARVPLRDADLLAFRSDTAHATAYRRPTTSRAYVGCVTVNSALHNLMRRRSVP